jgi:hypothetical protein
MRKGNDLADKIFDMNESKLQVKQERGFKDEYSAT